MNGVSAAGQNKWCLSATQSLDLANTTTQQIVCLARDGEGLSLTTTFDADQWYNPFYSNSFVTLN